MSKETKELDRVLNTPPEDEEEEDKNKDENPDENPEDKNKEEETEETEEEEEVEEKEKGKGESEEDEASKKDKWHGKSREDVIKAHEELEKAKTGLETKLKETEGKEEEEEEEEKEDKEKEIPSDDEFAKMTPSKFANWILGKIEDKVSKTYEEKSAAKDAVTKEIRETQKDHPLLKTSSEYRELVLALVDASASKGKAIPLKEACEKVDAFAGKEKGEEEVSEEEKTRLKKAKAQVESGAGAPSSPGKTLTKEAQRIQKSLEPASSESPLGGL